MSRRLAVIPARGGSKRIPRKNIRNFHGKPMLLHVLETARDSGVFDTIHVSTDDAETANIATKHGFPLAFSRPDDIADDHTPVLAAVRHAVEEFSLRGVNFDTVALLYPTAAMVSTEDLMRAAQTFEKDCRMHPLLSVVNIGTPLEKLMVVEPRDGLLHPTYPDQFILRTQDLTSVYADAAAFEFFSPSMLSDDLAGGKYRAFEISRWKAIDIDTPNDWEFAERLFTATKAESQQ